MYIHSYVQTTKVARSLIAQWLWIQRLSRNFNRSISTTATVEEQARKWWQCWFSSCPYISVNERFIEKKALISVSLTLSRRFFPACAYFIRTTVCMCRCVCADFTRNFNEATKGHYLLIYHYVFSRFDTSIYTSLYLRIFIEDWRGRVKQKNEEDWNANLKRSTGSKHKHEKCKFNDR